MNLLCNEAPDGENSATDWTQSSIQSHWGTINREVTKFCGIHVQVKSVAKSSWNDDNYYDEAKKLYVAESKAKSKPTKFAFKVCWEVLKVALKWTINCGYIHDPKSASKMSEEEGVQKKNGDNCPIGNKAAKIVQKTMQKQESQQLAIDRSSVAAMERKASGIQLAARTQRDEFHFQLFHMNPDSDASKKWMEMKLKEAVEEAELEHEQKK